MSYSTATIRQLLQIALDPDELEALCFDYFRPVCDKFAPDTSPYKKISILIEYCTRHDQINELLSHLKNINPIQYERFISPTEQEVPKSNTVSPSFDPTAETELFVRRDEVQRIVQQELRAILGNFDIASQFPIVNSLGHDGNFLSF